MLSIWNYCNLLPPFLLNVFQFLSLSLSFPLQHHENNMQRINTFTNKAYFFSYSNDILFVWYGRLCTSFPFPPNLSMSMFERQLQTKPFSCIKMIFFLIHICIFVYCWFHKHNHKQCLSFYLLIFYAYLTLHGTHKYMIPFWHPISRLKYITLHSSISWNGFYFEWIYYLLTKPIFSLIKISVFLSLFVFSQGTYTESFSD